MQKVLAKAKRTERLEGSEGRKEGKGKAVDLSPASRLPENRTKQITTMSRRNKLGKEHTSLRRACLAMGKGWRVSRHHMHRTHSPEARLMFQNVITTCVTTTVWRIPMCSVERRARRRTAVPRRGYNHVIALVARRGLAARTAGCIRALQRDSFRRRGIIAAGGAADWWCTLV